jgi:deazaflavin-dependent oxidoreductase (nitroreductase family)
MVDLAQFAKEDYCYLTTKGRKTGKPHEIEIWFGIHENSLYLLSGGGEEADWVKNLLADSNVTVRLKKQTFNAIARVVKDKDEERKARYLLAEKYNEWEDGKNLSEWARTALVVGIHF